MIKKPHFPLFALILTALSTNVLAQATAADTAGVKKAVNSLFEGMRKGDSSLIRSAFVPVPVMQTIDSRKGVVVRTEVLDSFLVGITRPHTEIYDERIVFDKILIDADLAIAWTPYQFYVGDRFSHCGVNQFTLVRVNGVWKIQYLIDTRRRQPCN
jgi:hypothetical protein